MRLIVATFLMALTLVLGASCANTNEGAVASSSITGVTPTTPNPQISSEPAAPDPDPIWTQAISPEQARAAAPSAQEPVQDFHQPSNPTADTAATTTILLGDSPSDQATRVALTVHHDPTWWLTLAKELDPTFQQVLATTRTPPESDSLKAADLLVISVTQDATNPDVWYISFDDLSVDTTVGERHVYAIVINPSSGLVTNVMVIA